MPTPMQPPWAVRAGAAARSRRRSYALGAVARWLLLASVLGACSADPNSVGAQANAGEEKNYVSGDGTIERLAAAERAGPVTISGTTLAGRPWSLKDAGGKVVVLNLWGSWCPPCVTETPKLQKAYTVLHKAKAPVVFMGVNELESPATAQAWLTAKHVGYPSLRWDGGAPLLGLRGKAAATPTTLVLDGKGRIAGRISGALTSATTLVDLVHDIVSSSASS